MRPPDRPDTHPLSPSGPRWALIIFWIAFTGLLAMFVRAAHGHGDANWISEGGYKDAWGGPCCGNYDCHDLSSHGDVATYSPELNAYLITWRGRQQEVPVGSVHTSQRPGWWVCEWMSDLGPVPGLGRPAVRAGDVRCLFKPEWRL